MKSLLYYLIQVMVCSGILYGYYHLFLRNKKFHAYNRFYLLIAATISVLIPFLNIPVYFSSSETYSSILLKTMTAISSNGLDEPGSFSTGLPVKNSSLNISKLLFWSYFIMSSILVIRILFSLRRIWWIKKKYTVQKLNTIYFVNTNEPGAPFSFFNWLFWNQKIEIRSEKGNQVFRHELFHIEQKHSFDILYVEFLTIVFWINPFLHLLKKELRVIHEFLADQFAINQGGKWEYAELLLMQSLNTEQHLTNPFFYNQIKRRIAMITSSQKSSYQYLRKVMVLPVAALIILLFAFSYKNKKAKTSAVTLDKAVTVVIDAGHGIDDAGNPTGVTAPDNSHEDAIVLSIAKKIKELNTNDRLQIMLTREDRNIVDLTKRVEFSNSKNADLLISLHTNAASNEEKDTKGIDVLYSGKNAKYFAENKILAIILNNYFHQIYSVNDIKLSKKGVYIIDKSNCASALVECGYLTDPSDLEFVKSEKGQTEIAKAILQSIEQYFLQKKMPDWEQRKSSVSDTASPVIKFGRNQSTGKMEGSYNGKKFNKMTEYEGQFAFLFDDDPSNLIMISKQQTETLKKKYGNDLNELIVQNPDKLNAERKEQQELKELLEEKQVNAEQAERELKELLELEKAQGELRDSLGTMQKNSKNKFLINQHNNQEQIEEYLTKAKIEHEELEKSAKAFLLNEQEEQKQRGTANKEYLLKQQKEYLLRQQKEQAEVENATRGFLIKQQEEQKQLEKSKKEYLLKQQKEQAQLEKSKKEFLIKQQERQKQLEKSKKEYLLKEQKEQAQLSDNDQKSDSVLIDHFPR